MQILMHDDKVQLGQAAAREGAEAIVKAIAAKGHAAIIVATGASQFEMLEHLVRQDIDWSKVTAFHLDEYVGISDDHPASFRGYLEQRFVAPATGLKEFVRIEGDAPDVHAEMARLNARIADQPIDVCFAGIGENCHLAFNDPPADFDTEQPYILVDLDLACRQQQFGEGWFPTLEDVPAQAISMSIRRIMASARLVLSVSDDRKAAAVRAAVEGPVSNLFPASIVQEHSAVTLHLDGPAASRLSQRVD
ncbi:glucosamine-6-phosphate deaminase [Paracoccus benzoatiresistens]|uniref:Glucosamine-6-phosphate deaminase n=1 Tax=Paracoccus benzoatiresistens TaxID=2997341 RepID=A0ABT4JA76_9RHOB|nr:glucosamine-6-phosphate deaminase [Paracoccus sp. EF6]MCZ0964027.1 glucosamine-6-phosphate deaminase [Paracoccus sp. EF6]